MVCCCVLRSPSGRVVKKMGHARSASMVDLLFKEAQAEAAGHARQLQEAVQRNEQMAAERIEKDWQRIQANVSTSRRTTPAALHWPCLLSSHLLCALQ